MGDEPSRVLVVEDDAAIRALLTELLAEEGYAVRAAADGREALALLAGWRPDAIVLDLLMPVMDGWPFRAEQRRRPGARDVPVVVVSASGDLGPPVETLAPAAVPAKPFDIAQLVVAVDRLAGRGTGAASR
jgi:CheY-like chemotaxis protein